MELDGVALTPTPSPPDIEVARQISALAEVPAVFPIILSPYRDDSQIDAYGFVNSLFCPLDLEVLT
jgi:hypothetical protein